MAGTHGRLRISNTGEFTVTADPPLPYGVELSRLEHNERRRRIELATTKGYVAVRGADTGELPGTARSMIGGEDDLMLLPFANGI